MTVKRVSPAGIPRMGDIDVADRNFTFPRCHKTQKAPRPKAEGMSAAAGFVVSFVACAIGAAPVVALLWLWQGPALGAAAATVAVAIASWLSWRDRWSPW